MFATWNYEAWTFSMMPDIKMINFIEKMTEKTFILIGCEINFHAFDYFIETNDNVSNEYVDHCQRIGGIKY